MRRSIGSLLFLLSIAVVSFAAGYFVRHRQSAILAVVPPTQIADLLPEETDSVHTDDKHTACTELFIALISSRDRVAIFEATTAIEREWHPGFAVMLVECVPFIRSDAVREAAIEVLEKRTGQQFGPDLNAWYRWIWREEIAVHSDYAMFKAALYSRVDSRFQEYFTSAEKASIRLDEIRWGGVRRDGIPPLKDPKVLSAAAADYLAASDIVFGIEVNGEARAYPKRILAWHEMVKDSVGGESINGVYCTLCGSMIVYRTNLGDTHYELGTSGFLYRSNKLMYDHATKSLWSTLDGKPVVGSLVGQGIKLEPLSVVTTSWGRWRNEHPDTTVLSLETGHRRDYGEGVAYHDYFATDELMFAVPELDTRLQNKDEVLAIRLDEVRDERLAISVEYLNRHRVYHDRIGETEFVVLTDEGGENRVYESKAFQFVKQIARGRLLASDGREWEVSESQLVTQAGEEVLRRLPAHRAFWFGWYAAFPATRLVK